MIAIKNHEVLINTIDTTHEFGKSLVSGIEEHLKSKKLYSKIEKTFSEGNFAMTRHQSSPSMVFKQNEGLDKVLHGLISVDFDYKTQFDTDLENQFIILTVTYNSKRIDIKFLTIETKLIEPSTFESLMIKVGFKSKEVDVKYKFNHFCTQMIKSTETININ